MQSVIEYKIDFCCWQSHHFEHIIPVWRKIPERYRGHMYLNTSRDSQLLPLARRSVSDTELFSFDNETSFVNALNRNRRLLLVNTDVDKTINRIKRPMVYMQHGAGQSYRELNKKLFRKHIILDLVPNHYTAENYRKKYPGALVSVVGCPKMDEWHVKNFDEKRKNKKPVVTLSFHCNRPLNPETMSAWPHFQSALEQLSKDPRWTLMGHGHPYIIEDLRPHYERYQIEVMDSFREVLERADVYVCDNSSTLYEFASTNRPVVVLNAPWFRRDVEHGLRFWTHADVGVNCDGPDHLPEAIAMAIQDPPEQQKLREKCVAAVYAIRDGTAANKAAEVLVRFLSSQEYAAKVIELEKSENRDYPGVHQLVFTRISELERVLGKEARVAIYGGGEHTERLLDKLPELESRLVAVIDKNYDKLDKNRFGGRLSPKSFLSNNAIDLLIISSQAHENQILDELRREADILEDRIMALYGDHREYESEIFNELYFG